jgi:hypothetical protein
MCRVAVPGRVAGALCALTVMMAGGALAQSRVRPTVPAPLLAHVRDERFQVVTSVRGLPLGVREALQRLFGSEAMAIAEPGAPFQATDEVTDPTLPIRRLGVAGCSQDHCLVSYERGGTAHVWRAVLFHWTPDRTRVEAGGATSAGARSLEDLRTAVLTGALTPTAFW